MNWYEYGGFSKTSGALARHEGEAVASGLAALGDFMRGIGLAWAINFGWLS